MQFFLNPNFSFDGGGTLETVSVKFLKRQNAQPTIHFISRHLEWDLNLVEDLCFRWEGLSCQTCFVTCECLCRENRAKQETVERLDSPDQWWAPGFSPPHHLRWKGSLSLWETILTHVFQGSRGFPGTPGPPGLKGHRVTFFFLPPLRNSYQCILNCHSIFFCPLGSVNCQCFAK